MKEKRKKRTISFIVLLFLLIAILIAMLAGNSFSKYLMQIRGKGIVDVAKWNLLVNGQSNTITNIQLVGTYDTDTLVENKIAPGTRGSFDIEIDATGSEVGIFYQVRFENETNKPTNLQFECNGMKTTSIKELEEILLGTIAAKEEEKIRKYTIQWEWCYETGNTEEEISKNDAIDTKEGETIQNYHVYC